jgi:predicted transposase/invertase (TIGR01784 family)
MLLTEWSNEQAMRVQRREGFEEGWSGGKQEGLEEGIGIGEARGERKYMIKVAQRLLAMGVDPSIITQVTDFTTAELESLQLKQ